MCRLALDQDRAWLSMITMCAGRGPGPIYSRLLVRKQSPYNHHRCCKWGSQFFSYTNSFWYSMPNHLSERARRFREDSKKEKGKGYNHSVTGLSKAPSMPRNGQVQVDRVFEEKKCFKDLRIWNCLKKHFWKFYTYMFTAFLYLFFF